MRRRGFTLLEMLVATTIMGIAVVVLLANLSTSMRNAARLTDYDRAVVLARSKMDELLADAHLPKLVPLQGQFDPTLTGGGAMGWNARLSPFEVPPGAGPGITILERLQFEVWWDSGSGRRTLPFDAYRQAVLLPGNVAQPQ